MFKRILIANRGEIACRIARTCREMGIEFVAVYSDTDARAVHLQGAVAAFCLGAGPAVDSYLNADAIITAALQHNCEAVHPGYGFLAENADFAQAVQDAGLVFIGPRPDTIAALGDKSRAKQLMKESGVPTVPGMIEASDDETRIKEMIHEVGLPVLLKPSTGGGGKGMQVLWTLDGLDATIKAAIRVAQSSFGDGHLIVERFIDRPRHVEVQIFGDQYGNVVHLFERECSLQRRQQKVVEEAPAVMLPETLRHRLQEAAVRGAQSIAYLNAGTFEFIIDNENENFYFLEVNTRLQVEHPVTEEITGLDLVAWQLRVAAGEPLPLEQPQIKANGCSIECRVYAEDPTNDFRPAPGHVDAVVWPTQARVEAGIAAGHSVPVFYDPMVAKLVVHGDDRTQALARMRSALDQTVLLGLTTNLGFLARVLDDPSVRDGQVHTQYLDDVKALLQPRANDATAAACTTASLCAPALSDRHSPWAAGSPHGVLDRAALSATAPLGSVSVWVGERLMRTELTQLNDKGIACTADGETFDITMSPLEQSLAGGVVNGLSWSARDTGAAIELQIDGNRFTAQTLRARRPSEVMQSNAAVALMPGVVTLLPVSVGTKVAQGDVLAIVEAMKMENQVHALAAGLVTAVHYPVGSTVNVGDLLVEIETENPE